MVDVHIALSLYKLLFEGFSLSLRMSMHRAKSTILIFSILLMMVANATFSIQFIVDDGGDDIPLLRLMNFSVGPSVIFFF